MKIKDILYEKFGAFSKKAFEVLMTLQKYDIDNVHDLVKKVGFGYKTIQQILWSLPDLIKLEDEKILISEQLKEITDNVVGGDTHKNLERMMKEIVHRFKVNNRNVDHISANYFTCCKRAEYINSNYELGKCKLLFLGDHDLTAIAVALFCKFENIDCDLTVFDIDENVLDYIFLIRQKYGLKINIIHSDFRFDISNQLSDLYDVVFTDPPYTYEGMSTFLNIGVKALKNSCFSAINISYKAAEQSNKLGWMVQKAIFEHKLYIKEITSNFNEYEAAEALGYRSDLYLCYLTTDSKQIKINKNKLNIYTHGVNSVESKSCKSNIDEFIDFMKTNYTTENLYYIGNDCIKGAERLELYKYVFQKLYGSFHGTTNKNYLLDVSDLENSIELRVLLLCDFQKCYYLSKIDFSKMHDENPIVCLVNQIFDINLEKKIGQKYLYKLSKKKLQHEKFLLYHSIGNRGNIKNSFVKIITNYSKYTKNEARQLVDEFNIPELDIVSLFNLPKCLINELLYKTKQLEKKILKGN